MEVIRMPGSLVSSHCNFTYHRSNAATPAYIIHQHDCYELYYYISGDLHFLYDGTEYAPAPHTMLLVVPGLLHGLHVLSEATYERYTFHFTTGFFARERQDLLSRLLPNLESVRKRNSFIPFYLEQGERFQIRGMLDTILSLPDHHSDPKTQLQLASVIMESLLVKLYLNRGENASFILPRPVEKDPPELAPILDYLRRQPSERITLEQLSQRFYVSRSQLNNLFQRHFHTSVMGYVTLQRLSYAQKLLRSGIPAAEAAAAIGYSDYSTFYRAYLRHMGHPPMEDKGSMESDLNGVFSDPLIPMAGSASQEGDEFPDISFENNAYDPLE